MAHNPSKNIVLFKRIQHMTRMLHGIDQLATDEKQVWLADEVSTSPDFVDAADLTTTDIIDMISVLQSFQSFMDNKTVSTADRRSTLARILAVDGPK